MLKKLVIVCLSLKSIIIPDNVKENAFIEYSSLANITIPNSITKIEEYAFDECLSQILLKLLKGMFYLEK